MNYEMWKPVIGYEGLYEISNLGRVRAVFSTWNGRYKSGRLVKPVRRDNGYLAVGLHVPGGGHSPKECRLVHVMVMESFVCPRPKGKEVRHLDGSRDNNVLRNLAWGTRKDNMHDARNHGTLVCGERSNFSKLSGEDVLKIRAMRINGISLAFIADQFHISKPHAWRIGKLKTWNHL